MEQQFHYDIKKIVSGYLQCLNMGIKIRTGLEFSSKPINLSRNVFSLSRNGMMRFKMYRRDVGVVIKNKKLNLILQESFGN